MPRTLPSKKEQKTKEAERKQDWYSLKTLGESPSGPLAHKNFQHVSPWTRQTWRSNGYYGNLPKCSVMTI